MGREHEMKYQEILNEHNIEPEKKKVKKKNIYLDPYKEIRKERESEYAAYEKYRLEQLKELEDDWEQEKAKAQKRKEEAKEVDDDYEQLKAKMMQNNEDAEKEYMEYMETGEIKEEPEDVKQVVPKKEAPDPVKT